MNGPFGVVDGLGEGLLADVAIGMGWMVGLTIVGADGKAFEAEGTVVAVMVGAADDGGEGGEVSLAVGAKGALRG